MYKTPKGRLTLAGVEHVHALRAEGKTYQQIAEALQVCLTTVYNVCKKRTHGKS